MARNFTPVAPAVYRLRRYLYDTQNAGHPSYNSPTPLLVDGDWRLYPLTLITN